VTKINPRVVDISHHNYDDDGPYDFAAARRWGVWGVIAKATEDTDYVDPTYEMAREGARRAGLLFGAYHFFRPGKVDQQVDHFLSVVMKGDDDFDSLLLCLDHEDEGCSVEDVKQFMKAVEEKTGQCPVLYSGHLIKDQLGNREDAYLGSTRLWLAQYGDNPEVQLSWEDYWLWQFTGDGNGPEPHDVPGIGKNVDVNSWDGSKGHLVSEWAENSRRPDVPIKPEGDVPPHLVAMRAITGLTENEGSGSNPRILFMADYIAKKYPEQADYAANYTSDDIAWCGLATGFCMAVAGIEPVFGPTDTDRWMWAQAWGGNYWDAEEIDEPCLGAVIVMQREGGGHVTLMEAYEDGTFLKDGYYRGRGGNQSDQVNVSNQAKSSVIKLMWPKAIRRPGIITVPPEENQAMWLQSSLNIVMPTLEPKLEVDGDIGPASQKALDEYQRSNHLKKTGKADKETVDAILTDLITWNSHRPERGS
jgi:lysozyme